MSKRALLQHRRVQIGQSLEVAILLYQRWREDCIAQSKRWRDTLAQGTHVDHSLWLQFLEGTHRSSAVPKFAVVVILHKVAPGCSNKLNQLDAPLNRQQAPERKLVRWGDEHESRMLLWRKKVSLHAILVHGDRRQRRTSSGKNTLDIIGNGIFDDNFVTWRKQEPGNQRERLGCTGGNHDLVGVTAHSSRLREGTSERGAKVKTSFRMVIPEDRRGSFCTHPRDESSPEFAWEQIESGKART